MAAVTYNETAYGPQASGIHIEGIPELVAVLDALGPMMQEKLGLGLYEVANEIMTDAKQRTPVLTGNLRASGHVEPPAVDAAGVFVTLGFGGDAGVGNVGGESNAGAVNYAVYVHEDLTKHHPFGEAKFLENAATEKAPTIETHLAAILQDELARAAG